MDRPGGMEGRIGGDGDGFLGGLEEMEMLPEIVTAVVSLVFEDLGLGFGDAFVLHEVLDYETRMMDGNRGAG